VNVKVQAFTRLLLTLVVYQAGCIFYRLTAGSFCRCKEAIGTKIVQLRPNQSLKLTEPAVDDFAARQKNFLMKRRCLPRVYSTWNWLHVAAA